MDDIVGGRYLLQSGGEKIPQGNQSTVRRGVDMTNLEPVAIKFVQALRDDFTERMFERETSALLRLKHPNIVGLRDFGVDDSDTYYVVLDWMDSSLQQKLAAPFWNGWNEFYPDVFRPLLSAVAFAHLNDTEHRDIKPANILLDSDLRPFVADFGIATLRASGLPSTQTVQRFRSVPYAPPEEPRKPFVRDVFSLGVLAIQCMTPTAITDYDQILPALNEADLPDGVRDILRRCVDFNPDLRPTSGAELEGLLEDRWQMVSESAGRRQNTIWLEYTLRARTDLEQLATSGQPIGSMIARDLEHAVHAEFGIDKTTGATDRSWMFVYGASYRYSVATPRADGDPLRITAVTLLEFDAMEHGRRRSLELPAIFRWETRRPLNILTSVQGWRTLQRVVESHLDASVAPTEEVANDEQFELWSRVLDARAELARGVAKPMRYRRGVMLGRRATFDLLDEVDDDLMGTYWEAFDPDKPRHGFSGEVIEQDAGEITILLTRGPRSIPGRGVLRPYDAPSTIALSRQRSALLAIRDGKVPNDSIRDVVLDPSRSRPPARISIDSWQSEMDPDKKTAIELAVGNSEMMIVEGPPGTGKTRFIAELVYQILRSDPRKKILIASQTNAAVDNALERISEVGLTSIVRLAGASSAAISPAVHPLIMENQLPRWADSIRANARTTIQADAQRHNIPVQHALAVLLLEQVAALGNERQLLESRIGSSPRRSGSITGLEDVEKVEQQDELIARIDQLRDRSAAHVASARELLDGDLELESGLSHIAAREAIAKLLDGKPNAQAFLRRVGLQAEWMDRIESDEEVTGAFLATTSVVAGTCVGVLRHRAIAEIEFDLCIVDEASRATLTEAMIPLSRAKQWVVVGDTRQLPPSDEDLIRRPDILNEHSINEFDVLETLFQRLVDRLPRESQVMLRSQYRMIRPIGEMISACFYDGQLQSPKDGGIPGYNLWAGAPVTWLDTSHMGDERREATAGSTSVANRTEAKVLVDRIVHLDAALDRGLIRPGSERPLKILAIAPYMSQVGDIRRRVAATNFKHLTVTVMSVDAVQGREADIAFFSVTRSNRNRKLGFLGPSYWRRINVALSRARFGLVIVGDAEFIRSQESGLSKVLRHIELNPGDCMIRNATG
ncbi:AAA domain-containing protein [Microbacterium sp. MM2322]|uniref:AAA domain-containing protein n=1 Tax=Microbacterium sp. MM2322 TaxID=3157631 RepID=UPI0032D5AD1B